MWYANAKDRKKSLRSVHKKHRAAIKQLIMKGKENYNDIGDLVVISQYDLVLTQWAFIGVLLTRPQLTGFGTPSNKSIQPFIKHMFFLGKELGIQDEFNLCNGSVNEVIVYAKQIEELVIKPALESNFEYFNMSEIMLQGASKIVPFIDPEAFRAWIYKVFEAKEINQRKKLNFTTWKALILYCIQFFVFDFILGYEFSRRLSTPIFNALMRLGIYLANHYKYLIAEEPKMLSMVIFVKGIFDYIGKSL